MARQSGASFRSQVVSRPSEKVLVASARNMGKLPDATVRANLKPEGWQKTAWGWFDTISEYHYSCEWVGNLLSKASLTILRNGKPTEEAAPLAALAELFGGPEGQTEMLRQLGIHFTVAGEGYLVAIPDDNPPLGKAVLDDWFIAAATEVSYQSGEGAEAKWKIGDRVVTGPLMIRMWKPHPRTPLYTDSPSRAVLPILAELHGLTQHVGAQIDSRLASAGILVLPSEISMGAVPAKKPAEGEEPEKDAAEPDEDVVTTLIRVASTAIGDRSDPSAVVPVIMQVAGEYVDKIQHIKLWSKLDETAKDLRTEAIRRLALGMDMPPEVLEGSGEMNHWSSWQMEEAAIKVHTEPLLAVIVRALTTGYLHDYLATEPGFDKTTIEEYSFGLDTTKLRLRPNRSKEALELYHDGILNAAAVVRENGFDPAVDVMGEKERGQWLLQKAASGSTTPEIVEAALRAMKVPLGAVKAPVGRGQEARPTPSIADHPVRELPAQNAAAVQIASELLVNRALERAGNKLRTKLASKIPGVSAVETYRFIPKIPTNQLSFLLEDSWGQVERTAIALGLDPKDYQARLDSYTRGLLSQQAEHNPELMMTYLTREVAGAVA